MSAIVAAEWAVPSRSRPGVLHRVGVTEHGLWYCTCPAGVYRRTCRHITERADHWRAEGENMSIAMIASRDNSPAPIAGPPAAIDRSAVMPDPPTWEQMVGMAAKLQASGLLPAHIRSPEAAVAIILKGWELGVPAMQALTDIYLINGKLSCSANLMLALIYRSRAGEIIVAESTDERCAVEYRRREWAEARRHTWTMEMAQRAGLKGKDGPWKQYPDAMLRARCISAVARLAFADVIMGLYTPEELGAAVTIAPDGDVLDVTISERPPAQPAAAPLPADAPRASAAEMSARPPDARARYKRAAKAAIEDGSMTAADFTGLIRDVLGKTHSRELTDAEYEMLADVAEKARAFGFDAAGRYTLDVAERADDEPEIDAAGF